MSSLEPERWLSHRSSRIMSWRRRRTKRAYTKYVRVSWARVHVGRDVLIGGGRRMRRCMKWKWVGEWIRLASWGVSSSDFLGKVHEGCFCQLKKCLVFFFFLDRKCVVIVSSQNHTKITLEIVYVVLYLSIWDSPFPSGVSYQIQNRVKYNIIAWVSNNCSDTQ